LRARRNWTDKDVQNLLAYGAGGAQTDPALSVLDGDQPSPGRKRRSSSRPDGKLIGESAPEEDFDVGALSLISDDPVAVEHWPGEEHSSNDTHRKSRRRRARRKPGRRRAIEAAIGAIALILFILLILSMISGCSRVFQGSMRGRIEIGA